MAIKKEQETQTGVSVDFESVVVDIDTFNMYSASVSVTNGSTFTGTVAIEATNNQDEGWVEVTGSSKALSGATDLCIFDVTETAMSYVRLAFVMTTGSADFKIDWTLKSTVRD